MKQLTGAGRRPSWKTTRRTALARSGLVGALALSLTVGGTIGMSASAADGGDKKGREKAAVTRQAVVFHDQMRKLWEDHITWTRLTIVSFAAGLPDLEPTEQRLLRNQVDLGKAFKPYLGEAAGNQLTTLLREHILGAVEVLEAAKAGDQDRLAAAVAAWYENGQEIADFLSAANPKYWPQAQTRALMREHLDTTLKEATGRLQGNFAADIADYDAVHDHILVMSDFLSCGVIKRYPTKFGGNAHTRWDALCP
ncbi:hypothetical protein OHB36_25065 [Streptomyces sp. NBC_00320]|uniref:hypothetical protein n=1 Tax=Streptomyces sp. NBC_00320 TaxID=2975711 RepID=UPI00225C0473|nr:hypothetical protein [Streptomyces sp. NBC_00320]MCX5150002.1 hypothetical protein [Streptomyces sp. NBC_00320]